MRRSVKCIVSISIILFLMIIISSVSFAAGTNLSTATAFSIGRNVNGKLYNGHREEYWKITVNQNCVVYLDITTGGHNQNLSVQVKDSSGNDLYGSFNTSDSKNWGYQRYDRYMSFSKGVYYLRIYNSSGTTEYSIKSSFTKVQSSDIKIACNNSNGYLSTALDVSAGNKLYGVAQRSYYYDRSDYYKLSMPANHKLKITATVLLLRESNNYADNFGYDIYDSTGSKIKGENVIYGSSSVKEYALSSGTYYIRVYAQLTSSRYDIQTEAVCTHVWDSGIITKQPTCVDRGIKTYTCTICKAKRTKDIAATGKHTWDSGAITVAPTATKDGTKTYTCITCKKTRKEKVLVSPSSVKAKAKKNKVTVSWKKIKKNKAGKKLLKQIKSIQVQYSTDKTFRKDVKTKTVGKKKTKVTLKLQKKTTYYVRVRYKGSNGFSKWSKAKKVTTKK